MGYLAHPWGRGSKYVNALDFEIQGDQIFSKFIVIFHLYVSHKKDIKFKVINGFISQWIESLFSSFFYAIHLSRRTACLYATLIRLILVSVADCSLWFL